ncbi:hypothetical protein Arub01_52760 [Actinomadura rubrobrunea]|uniref:Uncharacterized protein n=1 Tax=Actinomadura rubrobrunea TaxID=115335 RepID=A0A9W6Q1W1_9ACTN|nr:hypothetical protein Arub01_52760 [Actinomadura rubrobrunea]
MRRAAAPASVVHRVRDDLAALEAAVSPPARQVAGTGSVVLPRSDAAAPISAAVAGVFGAAAPPMPPMPPRPGRSPPGPRNAGRSRDQIWMRASTALTISSTASSIGTPFFCSPLR